MDNQQIIEKLLSMRSLVLDALLAAEHLINMIQAEALQMFRETNEISDDNLIRFAEATKQFCFNCGQIDVIDGMLNELDPNYDQGENWRDKMFGIEPLKNMLN